MLRDGEGTGRERKGFTMAAADEIVHLTARTRTEFGKGPARRIRANHEIPAVLYGHHADPTHIIIPGHETMLLLRRANAILELDIEGREELALVKDVQRDPVRRIIEHVDLLLIRRGERVEVEVPIEIIGEPTPGTTAVQDASTLLVSAEVTHIPERIEIDVDGLDEGDTIEATSVDLPTGVSLVDEEAENVLVSIQIPHEEIPEDETADETEGLEGDDADAAATEDAE